MASGDRMVASTPGSEGRMEDRLTGTPRLGRTGHGHRHSESRRRPSQTQDGFQSHPLEPVCGGS